MTGWRVERLSGSAADLHASDLEPSGTRGAWVLEATGRALVLGSTQPEAHVDRDALDRAGIALTRRRSGGTAVLVGPGECVWVDVVITPDDPLWVDDVGRAGRWVGRLWVDVLASVGRSGGQVYEGRSDQGPGGDRICFAGRASGEVLLGDAKVVGLSQRRTRHWARFQTAVLLRWEPAELVGLFALPADAKAVLTREIGPAATPVAGAADALVAALEAALDA